MKRISIFLAPNSVRTSESIPGARKLKLVLECNNKLVSKTHLPFSCMLVFYKVAANNVTTVRGLVDTTTGKT